MQRVPSGLWGLWCSVQACLPIVSNDLGKVLMRDVISLASSMLGSGTFPFSKGLSSVVFRGFGMMVLEGGVIM